MDLSMVVWYLQGFTSVFLLSRISIAFQMGSAGRLWNMVRKKVVWDPPGPPLSVVLYPHALLEIHVNKAVLHLHDLSSVVLRLVSEGSSTTRLGMCQSQVFWHRFNK